jgi:hypothetical protein
MFLDKCSKSNLSFFRQIGYNGTTFETENFQKWSQVGRTQPFMDSAIFPFYKYIYVLPT